MSGRCCRYEVGKVGYRREFNLCVYATMNHCQRKTRFFKIVFVN